MACTSSFRAAAVESKNHASDADIFLGNSRAARECYCQGNCRKNSTSRSN